MKRRFWILGIVIVCGAGAWIAWGRQRGAAQAKVTVGRTVTAMQGDLAVKVTENGTLEPVTRVDVKSRVAGRVLHIYVKAGDQVRQGQLLAVVDPTEVTRQVEGVKAQLRSAQASLLQAQENYNLTVRQNRLSIVHAQSSLAEAQARVRQTSAPTRTEEVRQAEQSVIRSEAQVADAKRNLARKEALVAKGFIAQAEADTAQTNLALAQADTASNRQRVAQLKAGPRREDIDTSRMAVRTAQIQLETERANADQSKLRLRDVERARAEVARIENELAQQSVSLTETRIVAPISGEVIGKYLEEGELVASATAGFAQGAALVTIADLSRMRVRVNINEVDVARVRTGQPVEVRVDGIPGKVFPGKVSEVAPSSTTENSSSSSSATATGVVRFQVRITVLNPTSALRPGMTANVSVVTARHPNVVILPAEAVRGENKVVLVTGAGPTAAKSDRTITVGLKNAAQVEVTSGLVSGDVVEVPNTTSKDRRKVDFSD